MHLYCGYNLNAFSIAHVLNHIERAILIGLESPVNEVERAYKEKGDF
jgi:hypothetical protein